MFTLTTFVFASFLIAAAFTQNCTNQDAFKNVRVLKYILNNTKSEVQAANSDDLRDAYEIKVLQQNVPKLCEGAIVDFPELDTLIMENNGITEIQPGAFKNVPVLTWLRVYNNKIKTIKTGVFNYLNVVFLNLQSNAINLIETSAFDNMPRLKHLELDSNKIKKIDPHWFSGSPMVVSLTMSENELRDVPERAFQNMAIHAFNIWLMRNNISSVHPRAFQGVNSVVFLLLNDNKIVDLDDKLFANIAHIMHLSLARNQLKCFSDKLLQNLWAKSINYDGNPLDSDCVAKLKTWASNNYVTLS